MHREWQAAYEQLSMERGYCTVSRGNERYTPANLAMRALAPPYARVNLIKRGLEMTVRIGGFFSLWLLDRITGQTNDRTRVRQRAAQLRLEFAYMPFFAVARLQDQLANHLLTVLSLMRVGAHKALPSRPFM